MPKFRVGDIANGVETSEEIIEAKDELHALRAIVSQANLYCEKVEPKTYEIYWSDLTDKAKERLKDIYHDNIGLSPLAIIDIEEDS